MNFQRCFKAAGADFLDMRLRKLPAGLFKFFYFLRCIAACNGGALPPVEQIAFLLGSQPAVVERDLAALRECGLVEPGPDGGLADLKIFEGPIPGYLRTRKWRERKRLAVGEAKEAKP